MSHEGYLLHAGLAPFLLNAVGWLRSSPGAPVGVHPSLASLVSLLQDSGVEAQIEPEPREPLGVYCTSAYNNTLPARLVPFVKRGGGLLIGGQPCCTWPAGLGPWMRGQQELETWSRRSGFQRFGLERTCTLGSSSFLLSANSLSVLS
uniref:Uncharacterized protein n=1 Tax=Sciurus vulgaris TaxID=55149 RepID=A0A8D2B7I9_SCIVU